ncbi:type VII secretion-associated serine protease mycosin [Mycobacterium sp. MYCO198283]|nr:type VII secretion-associated serine protease mycosin [Mycobacterium sp. MYCO198283]
MAAATLLATSWQLAAAPPVAAIAPPRADDRFLPAAAAPAPPERTQQRHDCARLRLRAERRAVNSTAATGYDLPSIWRLTRGAGQRVAVIDTGVAPHPRLPRLRPGGDYVSDGDGLDDCDGHGTLVAGLIAAQPAPGDGFSGVAPDAEVLSIRQSSGMFGAASGAEPGYGDVDTMAAAVRTAADLGATVINISSVACQPVDAEFDDRALGAAVAYAVDVKDAVVVTAAGNAGSTTCPEQNPAGDPAAAGRPQWDTVAVAVTPAWYDEYVLAVGSLSAQGTPSAFTMTGPWVDVAAPGEGVVSLDPGGTGLADVMTADDGERPIVGTSFAAPLVTGVVALVRSRFPSLSAREVMSRIEHTAVAPAGGWTPAVGHGRVDAGAAVSDVAAGASAPAVAGPVVVDRPAASADRAGRHALVGVGVCLAVTAGIVVAAGSARRLR